LGAASEREDVRRREVRRVRGCIAALFWYGLRSVGLLLLKLLK
jgi:hypothetical protein